MAKLIDKNDNVLTDSNDILQEVNRCVFVMKNCTKEEMGAGIAQWLERRTRD